MACAGRGTETTATIVATATIRIPHAAPVRRRRRTDLSTMCIPARTRLWAQLFPGHRFGDLEHKMSATEYNVNSEYGVLPRKLAKKRGVERTTTAWETFVASERF